MHVDGDGCANPAHFHFSDIGKSAVALCHISNGACGTVWEASVGHHVLLHCGKLALSESVACLSVCLWQIGYYAFNDGCSEYFADSITSFISLFQLFIGEG